MDEKDSTTVNTRSQRPRNPRVPVEFSLDVEGENVAGDPFRVKAQAIKISRAGATIILDADVAVGAVVTLIPPFGREIQAEVNGVWNDQLDGKLRIGVKLLHPDGWFGE